MLSNSLQSFAVVVVGLMAHSPNVMSQDLSGLPDCALTCAMTAYGSIGQACSMGDIACACKNQEFNRVTLACYTKSCSPADFNRVAAFGAKTCASVGAPLSNPAAISPPANPQMSVPQGQVNQTSILAPVNKTSSQPITAPATPASVAITPVPTNVANTSAISNSSVSKTLTSVVSVSTSSPALQVNSTSANSKQSLGSSNIDESDSSGSSTFHINSLAIIGTLMVLSSVV